MGSFDARSPGDPEREPDAATPATLAEEIVRRLSQRKVGFLRYAVKEEIARGGQGAVLRVWDTDLRRELAMKVVAGRPAADDAAPAPSTDSRTLGRFLEEAQITGQLDHPGIVPIHEMGLDDEGRVYFTMKLVRGRELGEVFEDARHRRDGWTLARALAVVHKVCEALAYAHEKGVVHRDLKPANVMVGRFGAVYVMDWGIARVLERDEPEDPSDQPDASARSVRSARLEWSDDARSNELMTMDGDVLGTPAYMAPEQALGRLDDVGPTADVYSVGALLYHLFAGHPPHVVPGERLDAFTLLARAQENSPRPVAELAPETPGELAAICDRALARRPEDRYASMAALADDLAAFLEGRVVKAYETGAWAEARKWIRRNKALATTLLATLTVAVGGLGAVAYVEAEGRRAADRERAVADEQRALALDNARRADARAAEVMQLSALQQLDELVAEARNIWPTTPDRIDTYVDWLDRADALLAQRSTHETKRAAMLSRSIDGSFADHRDRWWHAQLTRLVDGLNALSDPAVGLVAGEGPDHGWSIRRRLEFARTVEERTVTGRDARERWEAALATIADSERSPAYVGLSLTPQRGLLPLGTDPRSGLWEFWHVQSGTEPRRGEDGALVPTDETGLVLVLIPAGEFPMGAQADDPESRGYDPEALPGEGPVHDVALSPFFISKYEMTQGQWWRIMRTTPSEYGPDGEWDEVDWRRGGGEATRAHPVEQVSWHDAIEALRRLDLTLPSEAQWEYAARAGTDAPWWTGAGKRGLRRAANLSDAWRRDHGGSSGWEYERWSDGFTVHAPVGSFEPNPFGLHDVLGNVWEWCLDGDDASFYAAAPVLDPFSPPETSRTRVIRGGSFFDLTDEARVSSRDANEPDGTYEDLGLRPARAIRR